MRQETKRKVQMDIRRAPKGESRRGVRQAPARELFYPALLLILAALLIFLSRVPGSLYGSTTDWLAQHVAVADTMRQTILAEGTLFPAQLPLGGGSNIYDFAYYGYLRPDVLLGCLLPQVPMEDIIIAYAVAGYLCSVVLFYFLLRKAGLRAELALLGGSLFLGAGCFFHIHRHIMFVNYMPFLLGAFLGVLRWHRTGKKALLLLMMTLIYLHSYYYSISCLLVIYLFFLYTARREKGEQRSSALPARWEKREQRSSALPARREAGRRVSRWWWLTWRYGLSVLASVAMAGVLLLPTAASVLNCASAKDGGRAGEKPLQMTWDMEGLLYSSYGMGLTLLALFLLLLSLCRKRARLLAAGILSALVCGLVPLALNGFLYSRAKILIPFLPLVLFLCMETLGEFWDRGRRPAFLVLALTAAAACLQYKIHKNFWVWVDLALVVLVFGVLFWRWRQANGRLAGRLTPVLVRRWRRARREKSALESFAAAEAGQAKSSAAGPSALAEGKARLRGRLPAAAFTGVLAVMSGLVFFFALALHRNDSYVTREGAVVSAFSKEEREEFYQEEAYRFDTLLRPYSTSNRLLAYGAGRTTMYTSTSNPLYSGFFYDEIRTPMGNNNRVGLYERANPFLFYLMGVRYLEAREDSLPVGYEILRQEGTAVLAEREDVLPLCYGSVSLLAREAYEQLEFPENLEALTSVSIVEETGAAEAASGGSRQGDGGEAGNGEQAFTSHFEELHPREGADYRVERVSDNEFTVIPTEPVENEILVVAFAVRNQSKGAVTISINGIQNKMSGASAPYPNHNENFIYFLSSNEAMTEFGVKTSGTFAIENLRVYSLDASYLGNRSIVPFKEAEKEEGVSGQKQGGAESAEGQEARPGLGQKEMARGTITMPKDGYLITSYPMQPGYRAYVDGEEVPVETVNTAFVGVPLKAGTHTVRLVYEPPLQKAGMRASLAGWLFWAGLLMAERFGSHKKHPSGIPLCPKNRTEKERSET